MKSDSAISFDPSNQYGDGGQKFFHPPVDGFPTRFRAGLRTARNRKKAMESLHVPPVYRKQFKLVEFFPIGGTEDPLNISGTIWWVYNPLRNSLKFNPTLQQSLFDQK